MAVRLKLVQKHTMLSVPITRTDTKRQKVEVANGTQQSWSSMKKVDAKHIAYCVVRVCLL